MAKRLGLYVFYNKKGQVNGYVKYLLKEMKRVLTDIAIVCNGELDDAGKEYLQTQTACLFIRENAGFDAGAYKDVILNKLGLEKIREYDTLVMFNSSFYGPLYPMEEVFEKMDSKSLDFWGITAGGSDSVGSTPYHIQSYFLVMTRDILQSPHFEEYWNTQNECVRFHDAVVNFELRVTPFFRERGFKCDTIIPLEAIRKEYKKVGNLLNQMQYELIRNYKCPVLKRKYACNSTGDAVAQNNTDIMRCVITQTKYDVDLIWEDIISEYSPYELKARRCLNYILSDYNIRENMETETGIVLWTGQYKLYMDLLRENAIRARLFVVLDAEGQAPQDVEENVFLYKGSENPSDIMEAAAEFFGRDVFCVIAGERADGDQVNTKRRVRDTFAKLIYSNPYAAQVKGLFEDSPRLGAVLPTELFGQEYFEGAGKNDVLSDDDGELLRKMGYGAYEYENGEKILDSWGCFWVRPQIFTHGAGGDKVQCSKHEFFRILPYLCKKAGYFTATVNNAVEMPKEYSWKDELIKELFTAINRNIIYNKVEHISEKLFKKTVVEFAREHKGIYIYGAGLYGEKCHDLLKSHGIEILGFIVSGGARESYLGYPVKRISEMTLRADEAIVVAMKKDFQEEVRGILSQYPADNVYYI